MGRLTPAVLALALVVVTALAGCGDSGGPGGGTTASTAPTASTAALGEITITITSPGRPTRTEALRCDPPSGTLPAPAQACAALSDGTLLAPPDPGEVCTEIYGGPDTIVVRISGVERVFTRVNGCEIARDDRLRAALGLGEPVGQIGP